MSLFMWFMWADYVDVNVSAFAVACVLFSVSSCFFVCLYVWVCVRMQVRGRGRLTREESRAHTHIHITWRAWCSQLALPGIMLPPGTHACWNEGKTWLLFQSCATRLFAQTLFLFSPAAHEKLMHESWFRFDCFAPKISCSPAICLVLFLSCEWKERKTFKADKKKGLK